MPPLKKSSPDEIAFREAVELEHALTFAHQSAEREIALLRFEKRIAAGIASADEKRIARRMRSEFDDVAAPAAESEKAQAAIRDAVNLLKGNRHLPPKDFDEKIAELERIRDVYADGMTAQSDIVRQLRQERDYQAALALQPEHRKLVLAGYRALQEAVHALEAEVDLRHSLVQAGHIARDDILPATLGGILALLSRETNPNGLMARVRRDLEARGIL